MFKTTEKRIHVVHNYTCTCMRTLDRVQIIFIETGRTALLICITKLQYTMLKQGFLIKKRLHLLSNTNQSLQLQFNHCYSAAEKSRCTEI